MGIQAKPTRLAHHKYTLVVTGSRLGSGIRSGERSIELLLGVELDFRRPVGRKHSEILDALTFETGFGFRRSENNARKFTTASLL